MSFSMESITYYNKILICICLIFIASPTIKASVIHVSIYGDDNNPGTKIQPFRSIQKAVDSAGPGDIVFINKGSYREFIKINTSGKEGFPVVIEGERGINDEWLTTIDPSVPIKGWILAPEVGPNVYKKELLPFEPREMTIDNKRIGRINDEYMKNGKGFSYLKKHRNAIHTIDGIDIRGLYWNGIEALYGCLEGKVYIRFRDGSNPNLKNIKASPITPAIIIDNSNYIVVRNLLVRGAREIIRLSGKECHHNIIENNFLSNGVSRIYLYNGPWKNYIRANEMTMDYYGFNSFGAGIGGEKDIYFIRNHLYKEFKFTIGKGTSDDCSIRLVDPGDDNEIYNNHIFEGLVGISTYSRKKLKPTKNLLIYNNKIHNMSSIGINSREGMIDACFHDNLIYDCNINIRLHDLNSFEDKGRRVYIYRNKLWNPDGVGYHFYAYSSDNLKPSFYPEYFIYHNSFAGGKQFMGIKPEVVKSGGIPQIYIINNIISANTSFNRRSLSLAKKDLFGVFDYNWIGGKLPKTFSKLNFGEHNIFAVGRQFYPANTLPDFAYCSDQSVMNAGIDLSRSFLLKGEKYTQLPGMDKGYFTGPSPSMGAVQFQ